MECICENCEKPFRKKQRANAGRYCSRSCLFANTVGPKAANWRGGRTRTSSGYIGIYRPDHPRATSYGYVLEHRLVMEQTLERYLERDETVHHINGNRIDNRPENLQLRRGKHGKGFVHRCADCGSTNILSEPV